MTHISSFAQASFRFLWLILFGFVLAGCGGGGGGNSNPSDTTSTAKNLTTLTISADEHIVPIGTVLALEAVAIYSDNSVDDVSKEVAWLIDAPSLASIDSHGALTTLAAGDITVTATLSGMQTSASFSISDASLTAITLTPASLTLASATRHQFEATGYYADGNSYPITNIVHWSSSNDAIATVGDSKADNGRVTAISAGRATISATLSGITANASVEVSAAILERIELTPSLASLVTAGSMTFQAVGYFDDQSIQDISEQVSWSSANTAIATISATGVARGVASGETQINATMSGQSASATLSVLDASLTRMEISPNPLTLAIDGEQQMQVMGFYDNDTVRDLTTEVLWTSSNSAIASIDNGSTKGRLTARAAGNVTLSAIAGELNATANVTVSAATLTGLEIVSHTTTLAAGVEHQLAVTGYFSDGSSADLSDEVSWTTTDSSVLALLDNQGTIKANAAGSAQIRVSYRGLAAFIPFSVTDATLVSITISSPETSLAKGTTTQVTAQGLFSDDSTYDLTNEVVWLSSAANVVSVTNGVDHRGLVTALAVGASTISARWNDVASNAIDLNVTNAQLESITIQASSFSINTGSDMVLSAVGSYSDDSAQDISDLVVWSSSTPATATVSNGSQSKGLLNALAVGSTTISAMYNGVTATQAITVISNPNAPVALKLAASPNIIINDGTDSTTVSITLLPAETDGVIADGTSVDVAIYEGDILVSTESLTTTNGVAQTSAIRTTYEGIIKVTASVGETLSKSTSLLSYRDFSPAFGVAAAMAVDYNANNNSYAANSWFALFVQNFSSREFNIDGFQLKNGNAVINSAPGDDISNGLLSGGEIAALLSILDVSITNNGITANLYFSDTATNSGFIMTFGYPTPTN